MVFVQILDCDSDCRGRPFGSHLEYVRALVALSRIHAIDMGYSDKKGKAPIRVLKNGSSYGRYSRLQDGAYRVCRMSDKERIILAMGTTGSEALHMDVDFW